MTHEQLIQAVEQMPIGELDSFLNEVLSVRARRSGNCLSPAESDLFVVINRSFSPETWQRFEQLIEKRDEGTIASDEFEDLVELTNQMELWDAERLEALFALARLRQVPFDTILSDLQLTKFHGK